MEKWITSTPVKGVLPRTVTAACTEKVPRQAEYHQQPYSPWSLLSPSTKTSFTSQKCTFAGMAGMQGALAGLAPSHAEPRVCRLSPSTCAAGTVQTHRADRPGFLPHTNPSCEAPFIGNVLLSGVTEKIPTTLKRTYIFQDKHLMKHPVLEKQRLNTLLALILHCSAH